MRYWIAAAAVAASLTLGAQSPQNALAFDKVDDYVSVANASNLINGKTAFSLSAWVYPTNTNPGWPAFDGIVGIRNDANADFYMLQLSATQYEVRFRNSSGTPYTITSASVSLNEWQHLALVYDGTMLKFYKNGSLLSSIAASGSINTSGLPLNMGRLPFSSSTTFYFSGRLDDVALWGSALSAAEVACLTNGDVDPSTTGLLAYYPLNVGIAGGTNTGIVSFAPAAGSTPALVSNMSMTGTNSNLVAGVGNWGFASGAVCGGASYSFGGQSFSTPGTYLVAIPALNTCDSVVELVLSADSVNAVLTSTAVACKGRATGTATATAAGTGPFTYSWNTVPVQTTATATGLTAGTYQCTVTNSTGCSSTQSVAVTEPSVGIDPVVTWNMGTLSVGHNGGSGTQFQWVSCPNFTPLANQTNPAFSPMQNGSYAVIATDGACSDTSDCVTVSNVGLSEQSGVRALLAPNPASDYARIALNQTVRELEIINLLGQRVFVVRNLPEGTTVLDVRGLPAGHFVVRADGRAVGRLSVVR